MKDGTSILMIATLYTNIGAGYMINGVHGVFVGIMITFVVGFILGIGSLILIFRSYGKRDN